MQLSSLEVAHVMGEFRRNVTALVTLCGGGMVKLALWEMLNKVSILKLTASYRDSLPTQLYESNTS